MFENIARKLISNSALTILISWPTTSNQPERAHCPVDEEKSVQYLQPHEGGLPQNPGKGQPFQHTSI